LSIVSITESASFATMSVVIKQEQNHQDSKSDVEFKPPGDQLYCILYHPGLQFIGSGTCVVIKASPPTTAFKVMKEEMDNKLQQLSKGRTSISQDSTSNRALVTLYNTHEYAFVANDSIFKDSKALMDRLNQEYMDADTQDPMPVWMADNYNNSLDPFGALTFCVARTKERAKELVAYTLQKWILDMDKELMDTIQFDLWVASSQADTPRVWFTGLASENNVRDSIFNYIEKCSVNIPVLDHAKDTSHSNTSSSSSSKPASVSKKRKHRVNTSSTVGEEQSDHHQSKHQSIVPQYDENPFELKDEDSTMIFDSVDIVNETKEFLKTENAELISTARRPSQKKGKKVVEHSTSAASVAESSAV
jgi:hypothetical protein